MSKPPPLFTSFGQPQEPEAVSAAWARFAEARDAATFHRGWLAVVCGQIEQARAGLLTLRPVPGGAYAVAAIWPDAAHDLEYLRPVAQRAFGMRRGIVVGPDGDEAPKQHEPAQLGYPIEMDGQTIGALVVDIGPGRVRDLAHDLRVAHWASAWLVSDFRRTQLARLASVTDVLATCLQQPGFGAAALTLVNEACTRLHCDRASLGVERHGNVEVKAISHTASFDRKSELVRLLGRAMDEVIDLDVALVVPPAEGDELGATAHADAAREFNDVAICSVPLVDKGHAFGVMTLERTAGQAFGRDELDLCKTLGLLLGPVLALELQNDRGALTRARDSARHGIQALFGPQHPGLKLIASVVALLLVFFSFFTIDHRVAATAVVEGEVQRAAVAPFEGFIAESLVRAGDTVAKGQVLARLDERDLKLEQARWSSEREQAQRKYRVALASQDRGAMAVLAAQVNQADAQLQLVQERLARTSIVAPFDGLVVAGDLSQLLGTPVEQGKVLFEVAPRERYRVILKVDERDIAALKTGQSGELLLSGLPGEVMPFAVKQITPVSTPQDGRNHFRVEAELRNAPDRLRPGMEGVGKVLVGQARLIWIWTHGFTDWLRLSLWNWMP